MKYKLIFKRRFFDDLKDKLFILIYATIALSIGSYILIREDNHLMEKKIYRGVIVALPDSSNTQIMVKLDSIRGTFGLDSIPIKYNVTAASRTVEFYRNGKTYFKRKSNENFKGDIIQMPLALWPSSAWYTIYILLLLLFTLVTFFITTFKLVSILQWSYRNYKFITIEEYNIRKKLDPLGEENWDD